MATVKENLIAAKALIDTPEKWGKCEYYKAGCYCAIGAVSKALGLSPVAARLAFSPEITAVRMQVPEPFWNIWVFNDHPDTTHADIIALFDRAIAAAE